MGDDDEELTYQKAKKKQQRQRRLNALHKIEDIFEPQELEKNLLTEIDQQIRLEDKPERFQLRSIPVTSEPDEIELEKEAEWIYSQAFTIKLSISSQEHAQQPKPPTVIPRIRDALNFIRNESYEVPFIASYRKEYTQPDLSLEDLWRVYDLDQKYCQLKQRKESLVRLFQRMQKYQFEQFRMLSEAGDEMSDEDEAAKRKLLEMIRPLDEKDIDRVRNAQTVEEFLEQVSLVADTDSLPDTDDPSDTGVVLMTLHSAKGLEFPVVFLIGMEEGVFPHMRSLTEPAQLEEERRLCYVGITRARERLFLSNAWCRTLHGSTQYNPPSRFLQELPSDLVQESEASRAGSSRGSRRGDWESTSWGGSGWSSGSSSSGRGDSGGGFAGPRPPQPSNAHDLGIKVGDDVRHNKWGEGVVLLIEGTGEKAEAVIRFPEVGEKRLLLSWAPLEKV